MAISSFEFKLNNNKLKELLTEHSTKVEQFLHAASNDLIGNMIVSFNTGPDGREYKRTKSGKVHRASVAGHPPNVDFGNLRGSLNYEVKGNVSEIHGAEYALILEDSAQLNRPFILPSMNETSEKIPGILDRLIE